MKIKVTRVDGLPPLHHSTHVSSDDNKLVSSWDRNEPPRNPDGTHITGDQMAYYFKGTVGNVGTGYQIENTVNLPPRP